MTRSQVLLVILWVLLPFIIKGNTQLEVVASENKDVNFSTHVLEPALEN
jgi:hypothetical protein